MGRRFVSWCAVLVLASVGADVANAGDRRSSRGRDADLFGDSLIFVGERSSERVHGFSGKKQMKELDFDAAGSRCGDRTAREYDVQRTARERRPLELFHVESRRSDVSVQALVGKVNGAQLSIGF